MLKTDNLLRGLLKGGGPDSQINPNAHQYAHPCGWGVTRRARLELETLQRRASAMRCLRCARLCVWVGALITLGLVAHEVGIGVLLSSRRTASGDPDAIAKYQRCLATTNTVVVTDEILAHPPLSNILGVNIVDLNGLPTLFAAKSSREEHQGKRLAAWFGTDVKDWLKGFVGTLLNTNQRTQKMAYYVKMQDAYVLSRSA